MRLFTFEAERRRCIGAELRGQLIDFGAAHAALVAARGGSSLRAMPSDLLTFLRLGETGLAVAREIMAFMARRPGLPVGERAAYLFEEARILAPVLRPGKILCAEMNYETHLLEKPGTARPGEPSFFAKMPSCVIGPGEPICLSSSIHKVDCAVELGVVIGKTLKRSPEPAAMQGVAGFTILNNVSARDMESTQDRSTLAKNFDSFCPLGPCVVTTDELPALDKVKLRSFINGKPMQEGSPADWLFPLPKLLSSLSRVMTLEPGDIVSTGTPAGTGWHREPQVFLQHGDVVRMEIEGIGVLENPVVRAGA